MAGIMAQAGASNLLPLLVFFTNMQMNLNKQQIGNRDED